MVTSMALIRRCAPSPRPLPDIVARVNSVATAAQGKGKGKPKISTCPPGTRLLRAGAVAFFLVIAGWLVYAAIGGKGGALQETDLTVYRDGGLIVRHVRPLYNPHAYDPLYSWGGYSSLALKFTYTPFAAIVFAVVSFIPWTALEGLSVVVNMVCFAVALWFTFYGLGLSDRRVRLGATLLAAALTFWLQPVVRTVNLGQINLILMAAIMWDLTQPDETKGGRYRWWKGVATGVTAGIKLTPLIFIPYLLVTRKWREAVGCVGGFVGTVAIGFVILPHDSSKWWLHGLVVSDGNRTGFTGWAGNQSLRGLVTRLSGSIAAGQDAWIVAVVLALVGGITAALLLERAGYHVPAILAAALTGLLVSPISWDHHWVWIALAVATAGYYAIAAWRRGAKGTARWLWLAVAGMIFTYAAWPDALFTHARNLSNFSLGLLWMQKNTTPRLFMLHGDRPSYVEYHWHGFQLIWGNAYILGGMALLVFLLATGFRLRNSGAPAPKLPTTDAADAAEVTDAAVTDATAGAADATAPTHAPASTS
jgi:alpha-1,2-mannosyltransferase